MSYVSDREECLYEVIRDLKSSLAAANERIAKLEGALKQIASITDAETVEGARLIARAAITSPAAEGDVEEVLNTAAENIIDAANDWRTESIGIRAFAEKVDYVLRSILVSLKEGG